MSEEGSTRGDRPGANAGVERVDPGVPADPGVPNAADRTWTSRRETFDLRGLTETFCPACGARLHQEKCKVVCRSKICVHRIVYNCAEF